jgi:hypothetical protein
MVDIGLSLDPGRSEKIEQKGAVTASSLLSSASFGFVIVLRESAGTGDQENRSEARLLSPPLTS